MVFEKEVVVYFLVQLTEPFEIFGVFDLVIDHLVGMLTRSYRLILSFGLFFKLRLQKLSIIVYP